MKKAFHWFGIILYLFDVLSDIVVGADFIERCHYNYAVSVFAFVWLPGLLFGGFFSMMIIGDDMASLFILGTLLGPIILIPGTLYYLFKAAINPSSDNLIKAKG